MVQAFFKCFLLSNFLDQRVEPILDLVFGSTLDFFGYQGPLIANKLLFFKKHQVLLGSPLVTLDVRREKVYPSLSALLPLSLVKTHPSVYFSRNLLPLLCTTLTN